MLIESMVPLKIKSQGHEILLEPGKAVDLPQDRAEKLLRVAPHSVRLVPRPVPLTPIQPGWLISWRDHSGRLVGGYDDRSRGTVQECRWDGTAWHVSLISGESIPLLAIRSVGKTDGRGCVVAAWTVREHGIDGRGLG